MANYLSFAPKHIILGANFQCHCDKKLKDEKYIKFSPSAKRLSRIIINETQGKND